ncbi:retinol dehydrogenase 13 [Eurytemora carolleeae]|uniref:retinol dehydrogenase 13 n=1 Tax=Eurytemora carolleeae TaxID=1294199 RepID=UPI000C784C82|nr:retinol dehydrogenase 13 [Eurytemora carolleeae]|eukprot:XP_023339816.1 retinol dehydrogenase 13-like [Eurytemora affinis]
MVGGLGVVGIVGGTLAGSALTLFLLRQYVSSKWGYFKSDRNLKGQVVIITGGNAGLGAEVVKDIAARGATVVLACSFVGIGRQREYSWRKCVN